MQGPPQDGIGTVVERLERRHVAVAADEDGRCSCQSVREVRRRSPSGSCVVSNGSMFGSTQCLRKLF